MKIYRARAPASAKFLRLKNCRVNLSSASQIAEDVNSHFQSFRDAPPPPIMYTGIFIWATRRKKKARERNNVPPPPLTPSPNERGSSQKGPVDRSTDKGTFHNAKLCGRLNFPAPPEQKCLLIAVSSFSAIWRNDITRQDERLLAPVAGAKKRIMSRAAARDRSAQALPPDHPSSSPRDIARKARERFRKIAAAVAIALSRENLIGLHGHFSALATRTHFYTIFRHE